MGQILKEEVNYFWVWVAVLLGLASHTARALRWLQLADSMGYRISFWNSFMGIMTGYLSNIALPRMGEFSRCAVVSKYEDVPFAKLLGTVLTERIIDMFMIFLMTLIVLLTQFGVIDEFLDQNSGIGEKLAGFLHSDGIWIALLAIVLACFLGWKLVKRTAFYERIKGFGRGIKEGLLSAKNVRGKGLFLFYSVFIWLMFYLSLYVCFFCFEFTRDLGLLAALSVFVLSCYGMIAPVQGGIGAWHFMVIAALMIYVPGEYRDLAGVFAVLTHAVMTLTYIVVGGLCFVALPLYNSRRRRRGELGAGS